MYLDNTDMDATTFNEAATVIEARKGSREAFGALVRVYQRRAYTVAYSFVRNREDALELAQDAFVKAYKAIDRFDEKRPFYPWLYRIVKNTCLNHLKRKRCRAETSLEGLHDAGFDLADGARGPDGEAVRDELRHAILDAMDRLGPDHREILMLRHLQELSYAEIAACLSVPQGTVMSRLHAARRWLRNELEGRV